MNVLTIQNVQDVVRIVGVMLLAGKIPTAISLGKTITHPDEYCGIKFTYELNILELETRVWRIIGDNWNLEYTKRERMFSSDNFFCEGDEEALRRFVSLVLLLKPHLPRSR